MGGTAAAVHDAVSAIAAEFGGTVGVAAGGDGIGGAGGDGAGSVCRRLVEDRRASTRQAEADGGGTS